MYVNTTLHQSHIIGSDVFTGHIFKNMLLLDTWTFLFEQKYYSSHKCDYYLIIVIIMTTINKKKSILNPTTNLKKIMPSSNPKLISKSEYICILFIKKCPCIKNVSRVRKSIKNDFLSPHHSKK